MMLKVLVVDDEILEQTAICKIISRSGLPVEIAGQASNGFDAIELAEKLQPDAMLVDIKMPGISGLELIRSVKRIAPGIKFVTITAYDLFDYAQEAVELGVVEYMLKPTRQTDIVRVLEKLIRIKEEEQAREKEDQRLRKQLKNMLPYIKSSFMLDLMQGDAETDALEERASFLGFSLTPSVGMIVDIDKFSATSEKMNETKRQIAKKAVFEAVTNVVSACALISLPLTRDRIVMLIRAEAGQSPEQAKDSCMLLAEQVRLSVHEKTAYTCVVGVGRYCAQVADIRRSFDDANSSITMSKVFLGGNRIVHSDDVTVLLNSDGWTAFNEAETRLLFHLEQVDIPEVQRSLAHLGQILSKGLPDSHLTRVRLSESLLKITRLVETNGADQPRLAAVATDSLAAVSSVNQASLLAAYEDSCRRLADLADDDLQTAGSIAIVTKAVEYLKANYAKDISLEDVAQLIPLNPYYFSRVFKREMGVNFIDYLTGIRIYQAKNLLTRSSLTVSEIAEAVGYRDANYFSRVFSRSVGLPPRSYRLKMAAEHKTRKITVKSE